MCAPPPMGGVDGVEAGLKTGLGGIDLFLQALRDLGKGKSRSLTQTARAMMASP